MGRLGRPQDGPRRPKSAQDPPRYPQERPRSSPEASRTRKNAVLASKIDPKSIQKRPPNRLKTGKPKSLIFDNPPMVLVVFYSPKTNKNTFKNPIKLLPQTACKPRPEKEEKCTPKSSPGGPGDPPGRPQDGPRRPQDGPRQPQDGPRTTPRRPQDDPRTPRDPPKTARDPPRPPKIAPRPPQTPPRPILSQFGAGLGSICGRFGTNSEPIWSRFLNRALGLIFHNVCFDFRDKGLPPRPTPRPPRISPKTFPRRTRPGPTKHRPTTFNLGWRDSRSD